MRLTILDSFQYFVHMAVDLYLAPFPPEFSRCIDQEGASVDTHELPPVQHLFLNDVELAAKRFTGVRQEIKRKSLLVFELFMRGNAVARGAKDDCILAFETSGPPR